MAVTYVLKAAVSDLTGGADFTRELSTGTETAGSIAVSVAKSATDDSFGFTIAGEPGTSGATGDYTVEFNVTVANTAITLAAAVARVNSAGVQQTISAFSTAVAASAGLQSFAFTAIDLGVWAAGDRLKVVYRFHNTNTMSAQSVTIETGTANAEVITPFALATVLTPAVAALALTGLTPSTVLGTVLAPTVVALTLTGATPTVAVGVSVSPAAAALTITGQTPVLDTAISPAVSALVLTPSTSTVTVGLSVTPSVVGLTLTGATPVTNLSYVLTPAAVALAVTGLTPITTVGLTLSPAPAAFTMAFIAPSGGASGGGSAPSPSMVYLLESGRFARKITAKVYLEL